MKKENLKESISKKRKQKRIICYISIVFLVILLFLPLTLRIFVEETVERPKDIIIILSCNSSEESISSTFLNGVPQNLMYQLKGNYLNDNLSDETTNNESSMEVDSNTQEVNEMDENGLSQDQTLTNDVTKEYKIYEMLRRFSPVSYDEVEDITILRTSMPDITQHEEYTSYFETIEKQTEFFQSYGFSCTRSTL